MSRSLRVACVHWSDVGHPMAGRCAIGRHGSLPSTGTCQRCDRYEGPPRGLGDVVHVAVKMATAGRLEPCPGCRGRRRRWNAPTTSAASSNF